ncbi:phospholipase A2 inhibitor and Ly6/PLAUR domain-containing protein-like [Dendrobates tinctorius]|uniref:phospholipase A2 inhibitor and Ly6/PLAUR domain-containing protein-like n=1 Tax=Dendrobates tinctorius TaxID=92724 RepID=UPI003CC92EB4
MIAPVFKSRTMSSLIGILSLFLTLAATSDALACTQCLSESSTCSGSSETCRSGYECGSEYGVGLSGGKTTETLVRKCTPSSQCNTKGIISTSGLQIRMGISCCSTDDCTPKIPELPSKGTNLNGLVCRSCLSSDSAWCYTSDTVQCTGDENMCILQTTKQSGSSSSLLTIRGCATKSICDLGSQTETFAGISMDIKTFCTSGSKSVHKVVLNPAVVCLLLLKLFF